MVATHPHELSYNTVMICRGRTVAGSSCKANAMSSSKYCFTHNPATKDQHRAATQKGGLFSSSKPNSTVLPAMNLSTVHDIADVLADTINRVRKVDKDGSMAIATANAIGHLSGKLIEARKVADLESRLTKLEASAT
jgi:hypothetical protein